MLQILRCLITTLLAAVSGAFLFGAWLTLFFHIFSVFFGPFPILSLGFLTGYVENPYHEGFVIGGILGCVLGSFAGLAIAIRQPRRIIKAVVISAVITALSLLGIFFLIETTNVSYIIFAPQAVLDDLPTITILWLFWLVPSVLNGVLIFAIHRGTSRVVRPNLSPT